jgi:hypothetical protein
MAPAETFDFDRFARMFPLSQCAPERRAASIICSPESLVITEQMRASASQSDLGRRIPCDIFVFGLGEPISASTSKIGGIPFRPAKWEWPKGLAGKEMTFIAQFNFCESKDLFESLPGDVLLVFSTDDDICSDDPQERLRFEWCHIDTVEPLCSAEQVPQTKWDFQMCYGARYRTCDYAERTAQSVLASALDNDSVQEMGAESASLGLERLWGMKIGGLPITGRGGEITASPWKGTFLCSLATVVPPSSVPYPWINHPEPLSLDDAIKQYFCSFQIRAGFVLEFYLEQDNSIKWWIQFL